MGPRPHFLFLRLPEHMAPTSLSKRATQIPATVKQRKEEKSLKACPFPLTPQNSFRVATHPRWLLRALWRSHA